MKTKILIIIVVVAIMLIGTYTTISLFFSYPALYETLYETISSYERIDDVSNSVTLNDMRQIPEVKEFLTKHVNTNKIIFVVTDPIFTNLHASGGYTGEYLKIYYIFDEPLYIIYGCWTDNANASDMLFTSDIINRIKDDSCLDHFLPRNTSS